MRITTANKNSTKSTEHRDAALLDMDLAHMQARVYALIQEHGYTTRIKSHKAIAATMTTTDVATKTIWLARDWNSWHVTRQVIILAHELVHVRQAESMGRVKFAAAYLRPRNRWIMEMQAYAESIAVARQLGLDVSGEPKRIAKTMADKYGPWLPFLKSEIKAATVEVLSGR